MKKLNKRDLTTLLVINSMFSFLYIYTGRIMSRPIEFVFGLGLSCYCWKRIKEQRKD